MTADPLLATAVSGLDAAVVRREIRRFLDEDVGSGDATTSRVVPPSATASGAIVAREPLVVAGLDIARAVFSELDAALAFAARVAEGTAVAAGARLASIGGRAAPILTGERLALNLLQRLSGIATLTRRYVEALAGTGVSVSDTRKTTPGMRLFEKYAVRVGGGRNHRMGLSDAILIKDNHLAAAGGLARALEAVRPEAAPGSAGRGRLPVQVEVDSLEQLAEALGIGVDAVLLDNMTPQTVAEAVQAVRRHPRGATCWIEASGGITLKNIRAYADAGVDTISVGALTHSAPAVDIALDLELAPEPR